MDIQTKNVELKVDLPVTVENIEKVLLKKGIEPLRYGIVKVNNDKLTINVAFINS